MTWMRPLGNESLTAASAAPAPAPAVAMALWPHACPMPGRQSYSAQIAMQSGPEPASATNAVGRSQTPRATLNPAASRVSASQVEARSSSNPNSGCAWIRWLSATRSSRTVARRSRAPAFASIDQGSRQSRK